MNTTARGVLCILLCIILQFRCLWALYALHELNELLMCIPFCIGLLQGGEKGWLAAGQLRHDESPLLPPAPGNLPRLRDIGNTLLMELLAGRCILHTTH